MTIYTLDLNFQDVPHAIAAYLVVGPEGPVLVETGPASTTSNLIQRLAEYGLAPGDIRHVLVTHIHLDHAGAAGWWAQQGAQVYVHHVGAPHLIDPSRLVASATRIYGQQMESLWGQITPAPAEKVSLLRDGDIVEAAGLTFTALDSPGHARHHHVYQLEDVAFTGDAAGIRVLQGPFIDLPAPPPEFEMETWLQTIDRLLNQSFTAIYPTHFGRVGNVRDHLQAFKALIDEAATFIHSCMQAGMERNELVKKYQYWNRGRSLALGIPEEVAHQYETANPLFMSVDGMIRYWRKRDQL